MFDRMPIIAGSRDVGHAHFGGIFCAPARRSPYKVVYPAYIAYIREGSAVRSRRNRQTRGRLVHSGIPVSLYIGCDNCSDRVETAPSSAFRLYIKMILRGVRQQYMTVCRS